MVSGIITEIPQNQEGSGMDSLNNLDSPIEAQTPSQVASESPASGMVQVKGGDGQLGADALNKVEIPLKKFLLI